MKKNRMMRLASILLVCVLLTTSVISGTFAKYTTQDSASDVARVAKWGVELQVVGNLYGDTYKDEIVAANDSTLTVQAVDYADNTTDVVAPGTENNEGFTFSLKGKPEVSGKVTTTMKIQNVFLAKNEYGVMIPVDAGLITEANFDEFTNLYTGTTGSYSPANAWDEGVNYYTLEDYVNLTDAYYPVVYTLAGNTSYSAGTDADNTLALAAGEIAKALGLTAGEAATDTSVTYTGTKSFNPNTDLATWKVDGETLTWAWDFGTDGKVGDTADEDDMADTILGMLENLTEGEVVKASGSNYVAVVEYTDYCLDTMFSIDITVEQVD